jgi:hypothetical protein
MTFFLMKKNQFEIERKFYVKGKYEDELVFIGELRSFRFLSKLESYQHV